MAKEEMLTYEQKLWTERYTYVAGIDEVGRGCLFGDVVAAAVILPKDVVIEEVQDSKALTEKKRDHVFELIHKEALAIGIGRVDPQTIDTINIKQAAKLAMKRAVEQLSLTPDYLLIDAEQIELPLPQM